MTLSTISGPFADNTSLLNAVYLLTEPTGLPAGFNEGIPL